MIVKDENYGYAIIIEFRAPLWNNHQQFIIYWSVKNVKKDSVSG